MNGVKLAPADFTATNGSDVVLASGAAVNDIIEVVSYSAFEVLNQNFTGTTTVADLTVTGDLTVDGTTTTINSTTLNVDDINITVASGAADAAAANGAGLTVDGANATFNYASSGDKWTMNKDLDITGTLTSDGLTVDGVTTSNGVININSSSYFVGNSTNGFRFNNNTDAQTLFYVKNTGEAVFNDNSLDYDFRVESDGNTHALFVDAGNDRVVVGSNSGSGLLTVTKTQNALTYLDVTNVSTTSGTDGSILRLITADIAGTGTTSGDIVKRQNGQFGLVNAETNSGAIFFHTLGATERMRHSSSETSFNESGADIDFRIESDSQANMLLVNAGADKVLVNTNLTSTQDVEPSVPAPMSVKNGLFLFRDLSTSGNDRNLLNLDTNGGWATPGNIGTYTNIRWSNGASGTMGQFGLTYGSSTTVTGANSEFAIQGLYHSNYGNSGVVAAFGANQTSKFMGGVTVNENGNNQDFRVESNNNASMLFVDGEKDLLSVGGAGVNQDFAGSLQVIGNTVESSNAQTAYSAKFMSNFSGLSDGGGFTTMIGLSCEASHFAKGAIGWTRTASYDQGRMGFYNRGDSNDTNAQKSDEMMRISATEVIVNPLSSATKDFRVESDSNTHALFVDAGNNVVNINATGTDKRLRVDSGNIPVAFFNYVDYSDVSNVQIYHARAGQSGNTATMIQFLNTNASEVGTIKSGLTGTNYNTSSDYRLKENVVYDWDATTRLKQLKPARFNFIVDADTTVDGFLAHEAQTVVPEAVSGTHNQVDDNGDAVMQGIDQSKLVPLLVKTIQELEARITALENA
ncbi:tail fiber domain-containing protein [Akkermansiaceae bacterium]|nr:tail fiber domain-containing protein [Akkermansiaceae bacterium]